MRYGSQTGSCKGDELEAAAEAITILRGGTPRERKTLHAALLAEWQLRAEG